MYPDWGTRVGHCNSCNFCQFPVDRNRNNQKWRAGWVNCVPVSIQWSAMWSPTIKWLNTSWLQKKKKEALGVACGGHPEKEPEGSNFWLPKWKLLSRVWLFVTPWTAARQVPLSTGCSRQEYWGGEFSLLQGIFPTQGSNTGLPHCRRILYQLNHHGSMSAWLLWPKKKLYLWRPLELAGVKNGQLSTGSGTGSTSWAQVTLPASHRQGEVTCSLVDRSSSPAPSQLWAPLVPDVPIWNLLNWNHCKVTLTEYCYFGKCFKAQCTLGLPDLVTR